MKFLSVDLLEIFLIVSAKSTVFREAQSIEKIVEESHQIPKQTLNYKWKKLIRQKLLIEEFRNSEEATLFRVVKRGEAGEYFAKFLEERVELSNLKWIKLVRRQDLKVNFRGLLLLNELYDLGQVELKGIVETLRKEFRKSGDYIYQTIRQLKTKGYLIQSENDEKDQGKMIQLTKVGLELLNQIKGKKNNIK